MRRFQAVLTIRGMETMFKIVEINDFKQLPHITLAFRAGNDASIKQVRGLHLTRAAYVSAVNVSIVTLMPCAVPSISATGGSLQLPGPVVRAADDQGKFLAATAA